MNKQLMRWKYDTKKSQLPQFYTHSLPMDDHVVLKQIAGIISSEEAEIETRYIILNTQTSSL